jgi:hypothetical protein
MSSPEANHIEEDEDCTDGDRRIGRVEGPEMRVAPINVHEIDDVSRDGPVDEVAERPSKDE